MTQHPRSVFTRWVVALVVVAICPVLSFGSIEEELDHLLSTCNQNRLFNGSVLVAKNGVTIYSRSFGTMDPESDEKIGPDHAFRLASVGKAFTAMTIMILEEEGKLSYEDNIKKHLPDFPYEGITIRNLLNHTSGLPDYVKLMDEHWDVEHKDTPERKVATSGDALAKFIEHRPPVLFGPGEQYKYSNTGYITLGLIAESASGKEFDVFLKEKIFEPLGMTRSLLYSPIKNPPIANRVRGFSITQDGCETYSTDHHYLNGMYGDGEIYTTLADMLKWDQALYTDKLVSMETLDEAFSPAILNDGTTNDYGFGWGISTDDEGQKIVSHGGGWVGFRTNIVREIETRDLTVVLSTGSHIRFRDILKAVDNIVHDREYEIPEMPIEWIVGAAMRDDGTETAVGRYRELRNGKSDRWDYYRYRLSRLGHFYLENNDYEKALSVFKLDVESFSDSVRVHNALGRAYESAGKPESAAECYRKSISLDSGDRNEAHRLLKEIKK